MNQLVAEHMDEIRDLCREYGVIRLELFGSAATGGFDPSRSDIDFLIEYPEDYDFGVWLSRYFELRDRLEEVLGHPVDLVMSGAMRNRHFILNVEETKQLLYAA